MKTSAFILPLLALAITVPVQAIALQPRLVTVQAGTNTFHDWWKVAPSPTDPKRVVACAMRTFPGREPAIQAVIYGSSDRGETWQLLKAAPTISSEASCAMARSNTIYFTYSFANGMTLWRSDDFGKNWRLAARGPYADSAKLVIEPGTSPNGDRVFMFADGGSADGIHGTYVIDRTLTIWADGGTKLVRNEVPLPDLPSLPHRIESHISQDITTGAHVGTTINENNPWSADAVMLGRNLIGALFLEPGPSTEFQALQKMIVLSRFTNDGRAAGPPVVVARLSRNFSEATPPLTDNPKPPQFEFGSVRYPSIAVGPGPHGPRTYVVYHDWRNGHMSIMLTWSDDLGTTWSALRAIDDAPYRFGSGQKMNLAEPSIAVNARGVVAVMWAEHSGRCWRVAFSNDDGRDFGASYPINPCESITDISNVLYGSFFEHHTSHELTVWPETAAPFMPGTALAASADGSFFGAWDAYGTPDQSPQFTRIVPTVFADQGYQRAQTAISGAHCCIQTGSSRAAAWLDIQRLTFDAATRQFTIIAVLARKRSSSYAWPLVLRIDDIHSSLAKIVEASNADNRTAGSGAAWVFDGPGPFIPGQGVLAGQGFIAMASQYEFSNPRVLQFRLTGTKNIHTSLDSPQQLFHAKIDILYSK